MTAGRRAAVLGSPITRSLSPTLHRAAYAALGLDWSYEAIECRAGALAGLLGGLDDRWAGLSLTMPLKRAVLPLLDGVSELASAVGGANTVVLTEGRRYGDNTDVYGIVTALTEAGVDRPRSPVVLGAGATACSALAALGDLGAGKATVVVRDPARADSARTVGERFGVTVTVRAFGALPAVLPGTDLVISTLPAAAADPYVTTIAGAAEAAFDVVYAPWPTALASAFERAGRTVVGGFPMLLHQAVRQVELMTGCPVAPVRAMRAAGEAALAGSRPRSPG